MPSYSIILYITILLVIAISNYYMRGLYNNVFDHRDRQISETDSVKYTKKPKF